MKTVLIFGGDKGIGRATVKKFANSGYKVVFTYNTNKKGAADILKKLRNVSAFKCDLSLPKTISNVNRKIIKMHGRVDILINCAAVKIDSPFMKLSESAWNKVIDVNLKSLYYVVKDFVPEMQKNKWGRIINFTSIGAYMNSYGISNYAASKAGVIGFTKSLACELARFGITVNAVAPGLIDTDLFNSIPDKIKKELIGSVPAKRVGKPADVAELVYFLASDGASYINAQTIHVNGGLY